MKLSIVILLLFLVFTLVSCDSIMDDGGINDTEKYMKADMLVGPLLKLRILTLEVVKSWEGRESAKLEYNAESPPYVVNAILLESLSDIKTSLEVSVYKSGDELKVSDVPVRDSHMPDVQSFGIYKKGKHIIGINSVGCRWQVIIGRE